MRQNIKTRRETVRVAYEEIKKLRKDMVQEGESMDKNKSRVLSRESLDEVRNLELQDLCSRRATSSKRMAGASRRNDGGDCQLKCGSRSNRVGDPWKREKSKVLSRRNSPRTISRCQTGAWTDWVVLCHHEGARVDIVSSIRMGKC